MQLEQAKQYAVDTFGSQFKQKCANCGKEVAVTGKIFAKRIDKVYAIGGTLKQLIESYHCKTCRKALAVTLIGTPRPPKKTGTTKVITTLDV